MSLVIDYTPTATFESKPKPTSSASVELDAQGNVIPKKRGRKSSVEIVARERTSMLLKKQVLKDLREFVDNNKRSVDVNTKYITLAQIYDEAMDEWMDKHMPVEGV